MLFPSAADRHAIRLDDRDIVAAAQILAWIALPHRPEDGVNLLEKWFWGRRKYRGETSPPTDSDLRRSRLEPQLEKFRQYVLCGIRAGTWFAMRTLSGPDRSPMFRKFNVTVRSLAKRRLPSNRRDSEAEGNVIRDIWSKRKPVAHLADAASDAIAAEHRAMNIASFDLEMTLFNSVWVAKAIDGAESRARAAALTGAFDICEL